MGGYLSTLARLALREARRGGRREADPCARIVAERQGMVVDPRAIERYLAATGGTSIEAFQRADAVLPPAYAGVWVAALAAEILLDPRAPSVRHGVVHLGGEVIVVRPARIDTELGASTRLDRTVQERRGWRMELTTRITDRAGRLCTEHRTVMLARSGSAKNRRSTPAEPDSAEDGFERIAGWSLRPADARRFARASGDWNPVHLSALTARPFGYRAPILHGFCLQGMAAHALIAARGGGDPGRLRRISAWFRRPLLLPARVSLHADAGQRYRVLGEDGVLYAEGEFGIDVSPDVELSR